MHYQINHDLIIIVVLFWHGSTSWTCRNHGLRSGAAYLCGCNVWP